MHHRYVVVRGTKGNIYDDHKNRWKKNIPVCSENDVH